MHASLPGIAAAADLAVSATVLSSGNCRFRGGPAALAFGALDPDSPADAIATTTMTFRCPGSRAVTFHVTGDDGLYKTGPSAPRMRIASAPPEYLPYRLDVTPVSGTLPRNTDQLLTFTATVTAADLRNAASGSYSDTVTVSILP